VFSNIVFLQCLSCDLGPCPDELTTGVAQSEIVVQLCFRRIFTDDRSISTLDLAASPKSFIYSSSRSCSPQHTLQLILHSLALGPLNMQRILAPRAVSRLQHLSRPVRAFQPVPSFVARKTSRGYATEAGVQYCASCVEVFMLT